MISRVALTVKDLARSVAFYEKVLNFQSAGSYTIDHEAARLLFGIDNEELTVEVAVLSLGHETIELMEFHRATPAREIPADSRSNDLWFQHLAIVVSNMDTAYEHVRLFNVEQISPAPQTLPDYLEAAGISAFYFKDPDGHVLELIHFPAEQSKSKGNSHKTGLFLGIDHTAIVVENTAESLPFYQKLGMEKDSQTQNYGPEQENLNQVEGAELLITGLKYGQGMGVEFLDFTTPTEGRPFPEDARPSDLVHCHTAITVDDVGTLFDQLTDEGYPLISRRVTVIKNQQGEEKRGFLVRDSDGHAALVSER